MQRAKASVTLTENYIKNTSAVSETEKIESV
jgi:hypothetical protein